jgi:hypothetical protein
MTVSTSRVRMILPINRCRTAYRLNDLCHHAAYHSWSSHGQHRCSGIGLSFGYLSVPGKLLTGYLHLPNLTYNIYYRGDVFSSQVVTCIWQMVSSNFFIPHSLCLWERYHSNVVWVSRTGKDTINRGGISFPTSNQT